MASRPLSPEDIMPNEFDKPLVVATHFGFLPIKTPKIIDRDFELAKDCIEHPHYDAVDKISILRTYLENNYSSLSHPLALAYKKPASRKKFGNYSLHFIGSPSGIAEATLIRAAFSILSEKGHKNLVLDINCVGDKESMGVYERELHNHVRKSLHMFSEELKDHLKKDVFNIFRLDTPEIMSARETAPSAINFLTSQSRLHFKEVLEYIEALGIEFRLSSELVGERNHSSHTIFAIRNTLSAPSEALAVGYRYSRVGRFFGMRKEIPMAGLTLFTASEKGGAEKVYKELPKPKFHIIQLGREAKIKTLSIIELLRSHRISTSHLLGKDKITAQLAAAEGTRASHLIIIGQKEALDNTATIRNVSTRAQDTVHIGNLPHYLKNLGF